MSPFEGRLERVLTTLTRLPRAATDGSSTSAPSSDAARAASDRRTSPAREDAPELPLSDVDPDDLQTVSDVTAELGVTPARFVTGLLEQNGGRMRQQSFFEYTAWSKWTLSRLLGRLESDGDIDRVQVGREKVVFLPDAAPARGFSDSAAPQSDTGSRRAPATVEN